VAVSSVTANAPHFLMLSISTFDWLTYRASLQSGCSSDGMEPAKS